jgi:uncharacterized protein YjaZ
MKSEVVSFLNNLPDSKDKIMIHVFSELRKLKSERLGFESKEDAEKVLNFHIFDSDQKTCVELNFDEAGIIEQIDKALESAQKYLPLSTARVCVFPSWNSFIRTEMGGVCGYTTPSGIILVFMTSGVERLCNTIVHEYNHVFAFSKRLPRTLLDRIISEGLAENFVEEVLSTSPSVWTRAIREDDVLKELKIIGNLLTSQDRRVQNGVIYGSERYPRWGGYSLGYWIVKRFLLSNKLSWEAIMNLDSSDFILDFGFQKFRIESY